MKYIFTLAVALLNISSINSANTFPASSTKPTTAPLLKTSDSTLIKELQKQVNQYSQTLSHNTLKPLGSLLTKTVTPRIKELYKTFQEEVEGSKKRDVSKSIKSKPYDAIKYLMNFFAHIEESLEPLLTKYTTLKNDRLAQKYNNAVQKVIDTTLAIQEEYYALKVNIIVPYQACKEVVTQGAITSVTKLLEHISW